MYDGNGVIRGPSTIMRAQSIRVNLYEGRSVQRFVVKTNLVLVWVECMLALLAILKRQLS